VHDFTSFATKLNEAQAQRAEEGKTALETVRKSAIGSETAPGSRVSGRSCCGSKAAVSLPDGPHDRGSLVDVGRGYRRPEWMAEALAAKTASGRPDRAGARVVPGKVLYMQDNELN